MIAAVGDRHGVRVRRHAGSTYRMTIGVRGARCPARPVVTQKPRHTIVRCRTRGLETTAAERGRRGDARDARVDLHANSGVAGGEVRAVAVAVAVLDAQRVGHGVGRDTRALAGRPDDAADRTAVDRTNAVVLPDQVTFMTEVDRVPDAHRARRRGALR